MASIVLLVNFLGDIFCLGDKVDVTLDKADRGDDVRGEPNDEVLDILGVVESSTDDDEEFKIIFEGRLDQEDDLDFLGISVMNLQPK
jgi:hypothetical protein